MVSRENLKISIDTKSSPLVFKSKPFIIDNLSVPCILGMDLIQGILIKDSNFVTINQKEVPRVSLKSSAFLNAIIEVDDYQADKKELEQFQQRRKENAARTNFKPNISSFGDTTPAQKSQLITIIEKYKLAFSMDDSDANNKRYLLTCIDELTSYLDGEPIHSKTDSMVSRGLLKLILRHGINGIIISDNGREFGPLCKEIMKKFDIHHVTTSAYNSGSNGKVERSHRDIEKFITTLGGNNRNWSLKWPEACYFMNNLGRATLDSLSPNECVFGRSFHVP
jgi:hypothetical protein